MAVLQTILILILVYYGLKLTLKWLAPRILNYAAKKTQERFQEQFGHYQNTSDTTDHGDATTVKRKSHRKSNPSKKVGEYIDFEEIE
ncbi:DUF4834 family protein [Allomuricauda sp. d1]|uniref:DUF4834 family protein n=1 Tax=Allomuricauda sp. d1 TaxID=3136725 RepID=UPI0031D59898